MGMGMLEKGCSCTEGRKNRGDCGVKPASSRKKVQQFCSCTATLVRAIQKVCFMKPRAERTHSFVGNPIEPPMRFPQTCGIVSDKALHESEKLTMEGGRARLGILSELYKVKRPAQEARVFVLEQRYRDPAFGTSFLGRSVE